MAKYDNGYRYPYGATTTDLTMIGLSAICYQPDKPDPFDFIYSPLFIPIYIIDLPFSLVTDTITLPYDLIHIRKVGQPIEEYQRETEHHPAPYPEPLTVQER